MWLVSLRIYNLTIINYLCLSLNLIFQARRKEVFIQERYGRFNLSDPFLALQRDYEAGAGAKEKSICTNPLSILEAVMAHCRKMQERMAAQLVTAENRQKKVSFPFFLFWMLSRKIGIFFFY